jgi:hypothetical protein
VADKSLPRLAPAQEKLGLPTIMDRALAARHGVRYVHLAAFAIDVDRVREAVEGYDDPRPFGWEVLLTEAYVLERFDGNDTAILEDAVLAILDGEPDALGSQLPFAVWDAIERGELPRSLREAFKSWRARPKELVRALGALWQRGDAIVRELAESALAVELDPPLAPPTCEALARMAQR